MSSYTGIQTPEHSSQSFNSERSHAVLALDMDELLGFYKKKSQPSVVRKVMIATKAINAIKARIAKTRETRETIPMMHKE